MIYSYAGSGSVKLEAIRCVIQRFGRICKTAFVALANKL